MLRSGPDNDRVPVRSDVQTGLAVFIGVRYADAQLRPPIPLAIVPGINRSADIVESAPGHPEGSVRHHSQRRRRIVRQAVCDLNRISPFAVLIFADKNLVLRAMPCRVGRPDPVRAPQVSFSGRGRRRQRTKDEKYLFKLNGLIAISLWTGGSGSVLKRIWHLA